MSTDVMTIPTGTSNSDDLSDQRTTNEIELRELVYQSLERDGLISRLKAQLRAAVFKTIEKASNPTGTNSHLSSNDGITGRICRALVLDWLEYSRLLYTEDVLKVETSGPNHPAPLTRNELLEQLQLKSNQHVSQSLLHVLLDHNTNRPSSTINSLPDHIKQSIDKQFPNEKINDLNRIRDHFRSLFSSSFDTTVLDAYLNKHLSSTLSSLSKYTYEEICLKWIQSCSNVLVPQSNPIKQISSTVPTQSTVSRITGNNGKVLTQARRSTSPIGGESSGSSSSSSSDNQRKPAFEFSLPTTETPPKNVVKKSTDIIPPPLIDFGDNGSNDDDDDEEEEEDTSASIFSKRNATPAALNHLKNIDSIIQGDTTPRTRTIVQKTSNNGTKDLPIEYDDESMSQSVSHSIISSVDDVTVDKASPSPSTHMDFFEDFINKLLFVFCESVFFCLFFLVEAIEFIIAAFLCRKVLFFVYMVN